MQEQRLLESGLKTAQQPQFEVRQPELQSLPTPLDPEFLDEVGGGVTPDAPRTTW